VVRRLAEYEAWPHWAIICNNTSYALQWPMQLLGEQWSNTTTSRLQPISKLLQAPIESSYIIYQYNITIIIVLSIDSLFP